MRITIKILVGILLVAFVASLAWQVFIVRQDRAMEKPLDEERPAYRRTVETGPQ